ncbi:MAG: cell division protein FtsA [Candidatus Midichloriaceae bacterium]|jgi:cell division protein FtsA
MIKGKNIISIIDLGSSKITCFIAKKNFSNDIEILATAQTKSRGVKSGLIINLEAAKESILKVIEVAENIASEKVTSIYIGVNSSFLISNRNIIYLTLSNQEVTINDMNKILFKAIEKYNKQEVELIHTLPYEYILDGNKGITHPLGLHGNKITSLFHIITSPINYINNIEKCLEKCQLSVSGYISTGYASGLACLNNNEVDFGSVVIEIGAETTTASVFYNKNVIFTDGLPYGGVNITRDIAKVLNLEFDVAEKLKIFHGSVNSSTISIDELINIGELFNLNEELSISTKELSDIITARITEILDLIKDKLIENDMLDVINKIIITGGSAQLIGISELTQKLFAIKSRLGKPINNIGLSDEYSSYPFAVPIGMLKNINNITSTNKNLLQNESNVFQKTWKWLKENF